MTMFKTKEQIEEIREKFYKWFSSTGYFPHAQGISDVAYIEGYAQAQQDIKKACSEGFKEYSKTSRIWSEGRMEVAQEAWQACALSKMKELQEKDEIIVNKVNKIIERDKELQGKDEEIERLKSLIKQESKE